MIQHGIEAPNVIHTDTLAENCRNRPKNQAEINSL